MSSKHLRGDVNYAWPSAEVAVMGAKVTADATQNSECVLCCSSSIDRAKKKQTSLLFKINSKHTFQHTVFTFSSYPAILSIALQYFKKKIWCCPTILSQKPLSWYLFRVLCRSSSGERRTRRRLKPNMWRSLPTLSLQLSEVLFTPPQSLTRYTTPEPCCLHHPKASLSHDIYALMAMAVMLSSFNHFFSFVSQVLLTTSFSPQPPERGSAETWRSWPVRSKATHGKNMPTFPCKAVCLV